MIKLLICDCNLAHLNQRVHNIQKTRSFFGGCKNDDFQHKILVAVCNVFPFNLLSGLTNIVSNKRCVVGYLGPYYICSFCLALRYMLKFSAQKVCLEDDTFNSFNICFNSFDFVKVI